MKGPHVRVFLFCPRLLEYSINNDCTYTVVISLTYHLTLKTIMLNQPLNILVVDDEPHLLSDIAEGLEIEGYNCRTALDGHQAIEYATKYLPDLVLLDLMMPRVSGFEVLNRLKDQPLTSEIPIIILSGKIDQSTILGCLERGAEDFITKPFTYEELLVRIKIVLKKKMAIYTRTHTSDVVKHIFISYKRNDWSQFVNPLVNIFETERLPYWVDQKSIEGSHDWLDEINTALKVASCLVLCITPDALESRYVKMEYRYAFNNLIPIFPIICKKSDLPAELQLFQYYEYHQLTDLILALKRKI
ncbi:response regulator [Phototrophicus methaneseepsis]|uniref:Response regulator n=1 Tax=Phototrophicus methaneseepsis TaxID=2710758 RepID=A0A7S8IFP8_9CHLR|nr:response regulator [Phototrophicus methaneseepsis]QPC83173.1 response regulator [Phototrophicus methaneseepsis]